MSTTTTDRTTEAMKQTDETADDLAVDDVYHLLQVERRRAALRYLQGREDSVRMRDLAEQVAAWEHDTTVEALSSRQRQRVYIPLYQRHLPKLDEHGVIDYEQDRGIVERTDRADRLDPYLGHHDDVEGAADDADDHDDRDSFDRNSAIGAREDDTDDVDGDGSTVPWNRYYLATSCVGMAVLGGAVLELPGVSTLSGVAVSALVFAMFCALTIARAVDDAVERLAG